MRLLMGNKFKSRITDIAIFIFVLVSMVIPTIKTYNKLGLTYARAQIGTYAIVAFLGLFAAYIINKIFDILQ